MTFELEPFIEEGGVFVDVDGNTVEEVYTSVCSLLKLPKSFTKEELLEELLAREKILSTAVGNGVAIPHPRKPILQKEEEQLLAVCFLKKPLEMNAPDGKPVSVLFVLLSKSNQLHLQVLSSLAHLLHDDSFKKILETRPSKEELFAAIKTVALKRK